MIKSIEMSTSNPYRGMPIWWEEMESKYGLRY